MCICNVPIYQYAVDAFDYGYKTAEALFDRIGEIVADCIVCLVGYLCGVTSPSIVNELKPTDLILFESEVVTDVFQSDKGTFWKHPSKLEHWIFVGSREFVVCHPYPTEDHIPFDKAKVYLLDEKLLDDLEKSTPIPELLKDAALVPTDIERIIVDYTTLKLKDCIIKQLHFT